MIYHLACTVVGELASIHTMAVGDDEDDDDDDDKVV